MQVREELISLTPNNATLVHEVTAVLSQERLAGMLEQKALDASQVQVTHRGHRGGEGGKEEKGGTLPPCPQY